MFVGATLCEDFSKIRDKEDLEKGLGESVASLHIPYMKNNLTNVEEFKINVTVRNGQKMKCELSNMLYMKLIKGKR